MDRSATSAPDRPPAVRTARRAPPALLLPAAGGERREPEPAPAARRVVLGLPILRQPPDGRHAGSEPQTRPAADAHSRHPSPLSQTELEPSGAGPRDLSVPAARRFDRAAQPSLEHRYYLHSDAWRLPLFGRGHGLVQPLRAQLGTFQHHGNRLLFSCARRRVLLRPTRDLELRSGLAVHRGRFSGAPEKPRHLDQHGWTRPRPGQRFHRAPVALFEVRTHLPRRLRQRPRSVLGAGWLLPFLQSSAPAPGARLPHAGRVVPAPVHKEKIMILLGALPPNPRDLALFSSRMDGFFFPGSSTCHTMERLDRRVGQRRDATRAPSQARNGWRPHRRPRGAPASPSQDRQNFVQTMGSTSYQALRTSSVLDQMMNLVRVGDIRAPASAAVALSLQRLVATTNLFGFAIATMPERRAPAPSSRIGWSILAAAGTSLPGIPGERIGGHFAST